MKMKFKQDINKNLIKKTLNLLDEVDFKGVQTELNNALRYYQNMKYGPCILEIHKAFESTMKSILKKLNITPKNNKTGTLITTIHQNNIIYPSLDNYSNTLKNLLEKGLPNIRNRDGISHGQGLENQEINESYADFAINLACSFISLLVKRYKEIKPDYELKKSDKIVQLINTKLSGGKGKVATVNSYLPYVRDFLNKLNKPSEEITEKDVVGYLKICKGKYATQTLWLISSALKFLTYEILGKRFDYRRIRQNVGIGKFPSKRTTKPITKGEFESLIENETNPHHIFWMKFIWHTGVSNRQFRNIKIKDLDFKKNSVKIRNGNEIIGEAKLPSDFMIECKDFIEKFANMDRSDYLFLGYKGPIISSRTLQHALWLAGKQAKLNRNINCQILRISNPNKNTTVKIVDKTKSQKRYSRLKAIRSPLKPITLEELNQLCSGKVNPKHKYWFKLIYNLGIYQLMRDELYSMKTKDVNLKDKLIKVNSKWEKLSDTLFDLFNAYFKKFPNQKYIFQTKTGNSISEMGIRDALNRAKKYNNLNKKINYENLHKSILEFNWR